MQIRNHQWLLGILFTFCGAGPAAGGLITFELSGEITIVQDFDGVLEGAIEVGDSFSWTFTFESDTPDAVADDPTVGVYLSANTFVSGAVGALNFIGPEPGFNALRVWDDSPPENLDMYRASATVASRQLPQIPWTSVVILIDETGTAFDDDSLLLQPPLLTSFDVREFRLLDPISTTIRGEVTSFVPEPATLALLAVGSLLIERRRR